MKLEIITTSGKRYEVDYDPHFFDKARQQSESETINSFMDARVRKVWSWSPHREVWLNTANIEWIGQEENE